MKENNSKNSTQKKFAVIHTDLEQFARINPKWRKFVDLGTVV